MDRTTRSGAESVLTGCEHRFVNEQNDTAGPGRASIVHADLDAFYASVEQRDDPKLRGLPVIVGGGVVLACATRRRPAACGPR